MGWTLVAAAAIAAGFILFSAGVTLGAAAAPGAEPFRAWDDFVVLPVATGLALLLTAGPMAMITAACVVLLPADRRWRWLRLVTSCEPMAREAPTASCAAITVAATVTVLASAEPGIWIDGQPTGFYLVLSVVMAICWLAVWRVQPSAAAWARHTRLRTVRSLRLRCLTCGYPRPAPRGPCPECGLPQRKTTRRALRGAAGQG